MTGTIYCLENTLTDKMYIGKTENFEDRMHRYATGRCHKGALRNAILKYGWQHFSVKVVEKIPVEDLNEAERFWIAFLDTKAPNGYNLRDGGDGGTFSSETRELMREAALRRVEEGTHNLQGENNPNQRRLADGTHNLLDRNHAGIRATRQRIEDGTHHFQTDNPMEDSETVKRKLRTERRNKGIIDWVDMLEENQE